MLGEKQSKSNVLQVQLYHTLHKKASKDNIKLTERVKYVIIK